MALLFKDYFPEKFEMSNRYCPTCGKRIRKGDFAHRCSKKALNQIDIICADENEDTEYEENKSFSEKLDDYEYMVDPDYIEEEVESDEDLLDDGFSVVSF